MGYVVYTYRVAANTVTRFRETKFNSSDWRLLQQVVRRSIVDIFKQTFIVILKYIKCLFSEIWQIKIFAAM